MGFNMLDGVDMATVGPKGRRHRRAQGESGCVGGDKERRLAQEEAQAQIFVVGMIGRMLYDTAKAGPNMPRPQSEDHFAMFDDIVRVLRAGAPSIVREEKTYAERRAEIAAKVAAARAEQQIADATASLSIDPPRQ